ncbi:ABC transporter permease subunit, partial [Escherichia coli]|nr:ABC transporter permease subunit [Escherichia coli]
MLSPEELSALYLSAKVAIFATLLSLPFAIALAWVLARYEFRLKFLLEAILQMPMVLPPVVLGYLLLVLFGQQGWIGRYLNELGIQVVFNWKGAVLASMIVAFPLMVQPIRLSFQLINQQLEQVAATLGASPIRVFCSISLPLAIPG